MANFTDVRFTEDDLNLDAITAAVQDGERRFGPLLAISLCEIVPRKRLTCFTHERMAAPANPIDLQLCPGGVVPAVPGKILICQGDCFVEGKLRMVAAFR